jgi:TonB family protein
MRRLGAIAAAVALPRAGVLPGTVDDVSHPGEFAAGGLGRAAGQGQTAAAPRGAAELTGAAPQYPALLRERKVEGEVLARFRVGADGRVDPSSVAIVRSTHVLFTQAVRGALRRARYLPGDAGRPGDAELVEQTFRFQAPR